MIIIRTFNSEFMAAFAWDFVMAQFVNHTSAHSRYPNMNGKVMPKWQLLIVANMTHTHTQHKQFINSFEPGLCGFHYFDRRTTEQQTCSCVTPFMRSRTGVHRTPVRNTRTLWDASNNWLWQKIATTTTVICAFHFVIEKFRCLLESFTGSLLRVCVIRWRTHIERKFIHFLFVFNVDRNNRNN